MIPREPPFAAETLALVRDDALELASELEEVAAALRVVALGGAASDDIATLRANIDGRGLLLVEVALD